MSNAEIAETLRGAFALLAEIADETADPRLRAIAVSISACADAAEEAWERE